MFQSCYRVKVDCFSQLMFLSIPSSSYIFRHHSSGVNKHDRGCRLKAVDFFDSREKRGNKPQIRCVKLIVKHT